MQACNKTDTRDAMHSEDDHLPFQDLVDTAFFFPGGMRRELVDEIKHALAEATPLLILIGDQGSGKTMLCRMIEREIPAGVRPVFLPRTIVSFDELMLIIARESGIIEGQAGPDHGVMELLHQVTDTLRADGQRLLIIFDDADTLYLATLERIRRMLDQANQEGILVQILLSGTSVLEGNLEQLEIVAFQEIEERHFFLAPLDEEATWAYLNHGLRLGPDEYRDYFPRDAGDEIFLAAQGNFSAINRLARQALAPAPEDDLAPAMHGSGGSAAGALESGGGSAPVARRSRTARRMEVNLDFLTIPKMRPKWLLAGGGAIALLLLLLLLGRDGGDETPIATTHSDVPVIELRELEALDGSATPPSAPSTAGPGEEGGPGPKLSAEKKQPTTNLEDGQQAPPQPAPRPAASEPTPATAPEPTAEPAVEEAPEPATHEPPSAPASEPASEPAPEPNAQNESADERLEAVEAAEATPESVAKKITVKPLQEKKYVTTPPQEEVVTITAERWKKFIESVPEEEAAQPVVVAPESAAAKADVEEIYLRRLAAGARWLVGGSADDFTVQLMVLTAEQAEENLKMMLQDAQYQSISDQLFILRRLGELPTVMVFYGEFGSLAAARNARNNLPVFLRKHNPYAISIRGAVEKTTGAL